MPEAFDNCVKRGVIGKGQPGRSDGERTLIGQGRRAANRTKGRQASPRGGTVRDTSPEKARA